MTTTESSGGGDVSRSLELLWGTGERAARGPKPGLSLGRIVTAAVAIADAEGLAAVSMRRLSAELGAGTMSLYRHVPGRAELVDLMLDRVQGEPVRLPRQDTAVPREDGAPGWRATVETAARAELALYRAHPWLLSVNQTRPVLGPGAVGGMEAMLAGLTGTGLTDPELISVIVMVSGYVSGVARSHLQTVEARTASGVGDDEFWQSQEPVLTEVMSSGRYPVMAGLSAEAFAPDFDHFEFGLQRLLDGLAVLVEQRTG
ncbi:TetR/AcrR family transcriptional regulator [Streptomyces sp. NBC_01498]|uniref:TetR/AcrR family transcriptional regulator n=1 Tax=Streptomyces sp. NBC_01498 TaxID=2975870 RepID=UPI002E7B186A|nr:TetR/AcrR family transcriptional regulator [Streptomyces sp. NBC_01498]WTL26239.1 TetR/AcrR family transcriptional regulator [Streptomyces sp. NBC_01498]